MTTTAPTPVGAPPEHRRRHTLSDVFHERTHFDIIGRSWRWAVLSGTVIAIGLIALGVRGLNLGIDFKGGTQWDFSTASHVHPSAGGIRSAVQPIVGDATILIVGNNQVRVQAKNVDQAKQTQMIDALAKYGKIPASKVSVTDVGPTWGHQVSSKAIKALVVFFIVIALYLSFRFEFKMAAAAIIAVIHDIIVTIGVYAITGFEVTPATVIAFLTILGFSLYDTVVVFDKVKDNIPTLGTVKGDTYSLMVNRSMNQVLMRSLNTSFVALLPVFSLLVVGSYIFGALALRDFALALFVGLLTGAYSSIFVATPILAFWKEQEPRYKAMRERAAAQQARAAAGAPAAPVAAAGPTPAKAPTLVESGNGMEDDGGELEEPAPATAGPPPRPSVAGGTSGVAPRPRQQRRRKRR
ncbi:MAG TPA: protein translocase subunit SecF [Acidimicrobiia bacterium]